MKTKTKTTLTGRQIKTAMNNTVLWLLGRVIVHGGLRGGHAAVKGVASAHAGTARRPRQGVATARPSAADPRRAPGRPSCVVAAGLPPLDFPAPGGLASARTWPCRAALSP